MLSLGTNRASLTGIEEITLGDISSIGPPCGGAIFAHPFKFRKRKTHVIDTRQKLQTSKAIMSSFDLFFCLIEVEYFTYINLPLIASGMGFAVCLD